MGPQSFHNSTPHALKGKPFCAWDGEGITREDRHDYVMLANSTGGYLENLDGIPTIDILDMVLDASPDYIHVGFALGYDWNKWLKDLDRESLEVLYHHGKVQWNGYRIEWLPGKNLSVAVRGKRVIIYDIFPFFQRSFVSACDEWLGSDWYMRDEIVREKKNRNAFTVADIPTVKEYNNAELVNLADLASELRKRLNNVGIHVNRWDGPGAIAAYLYKKHKTKQSISETPAPVAEAARHAYAGGRFELIRKGHTENRVFQYDIRSAYPSAMRFLPCLTCGQWRHVERPTRIVPYGLYRIRVPHQLTESRTQPQPLWHRNKDGTVFWSATPHNWYWSPEAELVHIQPEEGWEYSTDCDHSPFDFVEPLYEKRAALKAMGDGGHIAYKLGLNSLYGKLAQQLGWEPGPPLRIPPYHCLEWAGYVTSHCRAQVYKAASYAPDDVIAFETDAVFSRVPLPVKLGSGLGEWEGTSYKNMTYIKSGYYYAETENGEHVEKTRGINKGSVSRFDAIAAMLDGRDIEAIQTRFITLGQALAQDFSLWGQWITKPRILTTALNGKRIDLTRREYVWKDLGDGWEETEGGFHDTDGLSFPYPVEWIDGGFILPSGEENFRQRDLEEEFLSDY